MQLCNITKSYGEMTVIKNFSAEFDSGMCWITGKSGVGKTTLLRIIAGLEEYEGSISDRPGSIAMIFQENRLFEELTPVDNCLLTAKRSINDIRQLLMKTGLSDEDICRPVKLLSGGMKRRTAIVRAICMNAKLILMDEPFTALDDETRTITAQLCAENFLKPDSSGNIPVVIGVTHNPNDMELIVGKSIALV